MASDNGNDGMLRRMVKMVAGPTPREAGAPATELGAASQFADVEKAELKAMIERKRRNDFVRKREFDVLRRIRREGLTGDQLYQLENNSRLDESEAKPTQLPDSAMRSVKAKIDAIEKQMVGGAPTAPMPHLSPASPPPLPVRPATAVPQRPATAPAPADTGAGFAPTRPREPNLPVVNSPALVPPTLPPTLPMDLASLDLGLGTRPMDFAPPPPPSAPKAPMLTPEALAGGRPGPAQAARAPVLAPAKAAAPAVAARPGQLLFANTGMAEVEVSEIEHDHELDEAVIAFANADFAHCERLLVQLTSRNGNRHQHADTWLVLFDLYRATGQQPRFDALTTDFTQRFQRSAPQWFSLPHLVMDASAQQAPKNNGVGEVGWVCPSRLDQDGLTHLSSHLLQLPQPWVMDWRLIMGIEPDAAPKLQALLAQWARQTLEMRWLNSERLQAVLQEATPVGVRDVDPALWLARLEALRLMNRADQFDEVAIDYCVTYEVSPPSWEPAKCTVRLGDSKIDTRSSPLSVIGDPVTSMLENQQVGDTLHTITTLELSGQLSGDISTVLSVLDSRLGESLIVHISCALLIRVDFIAAGDLLNWVIAKRSEGRHISFTEVHRLVGLMFGAMGITEHAGVKLRQV